MRGEVLGDHRPVETRVAEAEHTAVRPDEPVTAPVGRGGYGDYRGGQVACGHRPVEPGVTEAEDPSIGARQPVAPDVVGRHRDDRRDEVPVLPSNRGSLRRPG